MNFQLPDELVIWQHRVGEFVRTELQPHDASIEETGVVPESAMAGLRRMGLFGTNTPQEYGGLGLSMLGSCLAIEELAKAHTAFYYLSGVNVHIGSKAIEFYARPGIRDRWLPELASGRMIGAFALTEPGAGSDAARITTTVRRDGAHYILNGKKIYITNAPVAGVFTVFATHDPGAGAKGISAFAVDATTPRLRIGRIVEMAAGRGSAHAEVIFEDCRVPRDCLLGEEGQGFGIAMRCLDAGRTHWGAYCVGAASQLLGYALDHVSQREAFGRKLRGHQGIEWEIADMTAALHAARLVAYEAAWRYDQGDPAARTAAAALSKYTGAEMVQRVADATLQLFGGSGYSKDLPIERIWRETRVVGILDGTSEIMRQIIARDTFRRHEHKNAPN
ncbi:acyl-CoA dehydrogenase family protein [Bradyrhizobium cenepequi]|uniref:acyl-CoA dehydrogenase family protein n=1 Tax=Bradyrhizobium cenepequi TaxID=2821403 RepID=UPI001CE3B12D|nr:acyl-CoA dehydrogenase family protein [Bradyrhizobium cenepequi]MCA6112672.1 acyl-CoA dehydrogenase family protein [Bradyrhizobium cenepequi]